MAGNGNLAMAAMIVDLALDRMDVGDGREIEIFPPDIGRQLREEGIARRLVAGDGRALISAARSQFWPSPS